MTPSGGVSKPNAGRPSEGYGIQERGRRRLPGREGIGGLGPGHDGGARRLVWRDWYDDHENRAVSGPIYERGIFACTAKPEHLPDNPQFALEPRHLSPNAPQIVVQPQHTVPGTLGC